MKNTFFLLAFLFSTLMAYSSPSPEIQAKATVLRDFMQAVPTPDGAYGLDLPKKELRELELCFSGKIKLFPIKEYALKYKTSDRNLVQTCFWIRISSLTTTHAKVFGGNYPLDVMTKYGPMAANTTDFVFNLTKQKGHWKIISKDVVGAS